MKKQKELFMLIIAGAVILATVGLAIFMNIQFPESTITAKFNDVLSGIVFLLVGYYWGSSQGSQDKTDLLKS